MTKDGWLSARDVAARLNIKIETLYAYVSRGVLSRQRIPGERGSWFIADEVEKLAGRVRGRRQQVLALDNPDWGMVLKTRLTAIADGMLYFRGRSAVELAATASFEQVAEWLWRGTPDALTGSAPHWQVAPQHLAICRAAQATLPPETLIPDRIRLTAAMLAPLNPFRYDLSTPVVCTAARQLIYAMMAALPIATPTDQPEPVDGGQARFAETLWSRLSQVEAPPGMIDALNAALMLLSDHELATSTYAARVAASVRADPYSVIGAGLGAVAGSLHGGVGPRVMRLFQRIGRPAEALPVITEYVQHEARLTGFGLALYPQGDPRAVALLHCLSQAQLNRTQSARLATVHAVLDVVSIRDTAPNVDFALAALCYVADMPASAPEGIFAIARSAGWIAHAIEEYAEKPLRFRVRAHYDGAPPIC